MQSYVSDVRNIASQPHEYSSLTRSPKSKLCVLLGSPKSKDHPTKRQSLFGLGLSWLASCYHYGQTVHDIHPVFGQELLTVMEEVFGQIM